jgi:hypothetical protein
MHSRRRRGRRLIKFVCLTVAVWVTAALGLLSCSCAPMHTQLPALSTDSGTLIHVVGWDGPCRADRNFLCALRDGGCPMAMETFDWTGGWRSITAMWRAQHSLVPARELAARIESIWQLHPGQPISITADSSGCGVALAAIASLPPEIRLRTVVLSSPALSPGYDLRPALGHINGEMISFNSTRDFVILCLGTTVFGTVDNHHTPAAGRAGFIVPPSQPVYTKLRQIPYDRAWSAEYGHTGGHAQALSPKFARAMIAPLLGK